ncbi:MFS transporter, partial [Streptomyces anthocyanicus]
MASTVVSEKRPGYGQLLRTPGALSFLIPGFAARQPFAMLTIGIVLLVQHTTGSYGSAGAVAAVTGVSMALFAPQSGKLADRFGQRAVLVPGVLVHSAAVSLLVALVRAVPDEVPQFSDAVAPPAANRLLCGVVAAR